MDGSRDSANGRAGNYVAADSTSIIMPRDGSRDEKPAFENSPSSPYLGSLHSVASIATITSISTDPYADSECTKLKGGARPEKWWNTTLQVSIPFFLAGIGTIGAGLTLGIVKEWEVVKVVSPLLILVPPLLGLKGNLDMCLASRLSTQANLGKMDSWHEIWKMVVGNLAIVQIQAIVASLLVAMFAVLMYLILYGEFEVKHALLLSAASVTTATSSCFVLDLVMIGVVISSYKLRMNPDNLATPVAASIGDVVSITLLANIASAFYHIHDSNYWILIVAIVGYLIICLPLWIIIVLRNEYTRPVLKSGWAPVLSGLFISGMGGLVLDSVEDQYKSYAVFQPIINGIGGNLVAIQASRISTMLHQTSLPGLIPPHSTLCATPYAALFKGLPHAATARILICMDIVGQIVFVFVADYIYNGISTVTPAFGITYLFVTILQVMILLYLAHVLIHIMWKWKVDPDNSSIPILTALGDVLGSSLLAIAFIFLEEINQTYGK